MICGLPSRRSSVRLYRFGLVIAALLTVRPSFSFHLGSFFNNQFRVQRNLQFQTVNRHLISSKLSDPIQASINEPSTTTKRRKQEDSFEQLQVDAAKVLRELRPSPIDTTVPPWVITQHDGCCPSQSLSFANYWGLAEWDKHNSRFRIVRYMRDLYKSRLLRRIAPALFFFVGWTIMAIKVTKTFPTSTFSNAHHASFHAAATGSTMNVSLLTSLSLLSTFVALLQTLRSNQGLARLSEARLAMGRMVLLTRDTGQLMAEYIVPHDKQLGIRAARHLALFGWVLMAHLRETEGNDIVNTLLSPVDATYVKSQRKRPVAIISRLRQIMRTIYQRQVLGTTEHRLIEQNLQQLNDVIMTGERIRSSPVPPVYTSHAARLMTVYLLCLPYALILSNLNSFLTMGVTLVVAFAMMGLDEMSHMFEQPFRFMPLYHISKVSLRDVVDAFCRLPPPLTDNATDDDESTNTATERPPYWASAGDAHILPFDGSNVALPGDPDWK